MFVAVKVVFIHKTLSGLVEWGFVKWLTKECPQKIMENRPSEALH